MFYGIGGGSKKIDKQIRNAFGKVLRTWRRKRAMSQEALALKAGIDRSYVGSLERGLYMPTLATMLRLAEVLSVRLSTLVIEVERILESDKHTK